MDAGSLAYAVAFGGGIVSFLSPCVLPLVPAYLSLVTGLEVAEIQSGSREHLGRIARDTALFVAGFAAVFILLGLTATTVGRSIFAEHALLTRVSGVVVVVMAVFLAGSLVLRMPWLYRERRFHPRPSRLGPFAAPLTGAAFGFGWTPCIGPVLGSILTVAGTQGQAARGGLLLAAYSAGLGACFLAVGLAGGRLSRTLGWVRRHFSAITLASAVVMAGFGVLLALNSLSLVTTELQGGLRSIGLGRLNYLG
ncbi:MAG: cytochrome c biogenesis CcdA family protein [Acidimicrobiales bacterium]